MSPKKRGSKICRAYGYSLNRKILGTISSNTATKRNVVHSVVKVRERFLMRDAVERIRQLGHKVTATQALAMFITREMQDSIVKDGYQGDLIVWKRIK